ncbi:phage tail protein [Sphingomonas cannabina]|uniref:phage tail protein n=1 Tax=Sphingomonas cannabina TaxID=2899123 RepID=UPI001F289D90|nr:phage tail protein [Sphingomonas cannabina]UIJ45859.1 phage tail protein [Sphingomonas cannabina]
MATLVLTAVGGAIGGPIGAALGAALGGAVDRQIFRPKGREGPRLTDLAVQMSSYGAPIPHLFGTMRVAGTVIWSTDLIEHRSRSGGGKGAPPTTSYSYSVSFAVLLSARAVRGVKRIWADGKLLRGAAGDFKTPVGGFRLHLGGEEQVADPLIASAEGAALAPACRGQAYAVFEELALADYGNRIPSLTFEVEADAGPVSVGSIVETVTGGAVAGGEAATMLGGYSAYGASRRDVVDGLAEAGSAWFTAEGDRLALRTGEGVAAAIADDGVGEGKRGSRAIAPADTAPRSLTLGYYDPARDYQAGLQRADRPGAGSQMARIELPAVLDAAGAKRIAAAALGRLDVERERRTVSLDWRAIGIAPGDSVTIAGEQGRWRVAGWSLEGMVLGLELKRIARAMAPATATPGRVSSAPDLTAGRTVVHAFEIPPTDDAVLSAPRLTIAVAGTGAGWRSAALQISADGASWTPAGRTSMPAVLGDVVVAPGAAGSALIDRRHAIEVMLANEAMELGDADAAALDAGANLALVGDEIVQFGRAERIGPRRWRLTELWRGRRGTEWATGAAVAGDRFVLLEPPTLTTIDLPAGSIGGTARVMASGVADGDAPPVATVPVTGASVRPPSPVHVTVRRSEEAMRLAWVRRSRAGWRWIDGADVPLAEESERYRVTLRRGDGSTLAIDTDASEASIDRATIGTAVVEVRQLGSFGWSPAATQALSE